MYSESAQLALSAMSPSSNSHQSGPLITEIERYLSVVECFRGEGCEPRWAREDSPPIAGTSDARELAPGSER
jgi:hypothetical protein